MSTRKIISESTNNKNNSTIKSIPIALYKIVSFLEVNGLQTRGIFRISESMEKLNELKEKMDEGIFLYFIKKILSYLKIHFL